MGTAEELRTALTAPRDGMIFIEAVMDTDYGPRGPQHRPGVQI